jgi:hypothetical protein
MTACNVVAAAAWTITESSGRWAPGIGDSSWLGWATVGAYVWVTVLTARAARVAWRVRDPDRLVLWCVLTCLFAALGVNKQLDLQTLLSELGRDWARSQHLYEARRTVQFAFIVVLAVFTLGALSWLFRSTRALGAPPRLAALGTTLLGAFIVLRATSFHHVDALLGVSLGDVTLSAVLELSGIAIVGIAAHWELRLAAASGFTTPARRTRPLRNAPP